MNLHRRTGDAPVYYYYFDQPRPAKRQPLPGDVPATGAVHSGEIEYALGNLDGNAVYAWTPADRATSRVMQDYFVNFIRGGNPNGKGLPTWPAVKDSPAGLLRQTIDAHARTQPYNGAARQQFLDRHFSAPASSP
jgi:para-nitrobenzyl esterase